jgi:hypothetical protein
MKSISQIHGTRMVPGFAHTGPRVSGRESACVFTILKAQLGDALRTVEWA